MFRLTPGKFHVESETVEGRTYTIMVEKKGRGFSVRCFCPGFRRHKHCKHATAFRNGEYKIEAA